MKSVRQRGFTLIELMIVIAIIEIIAAIAIPNLLKARSSANEASAISSLRTIVSAQALFHQEDPDGDEEYNYATSLEELSDANLIDSVLGAGKKSGYSFKLISEVPESDWNVVAEPNEPGTTGIRIFYADQTGSIRDCTKLSDPGPDCPRLGDESDDEESDIASEIKNEYLNLIPEKFRKYVPALIEDLTDPHVVDEIIGTIDTNRDGSLSRDEIAKKNLAELARHIKKIIKIPAGPILPADDIELYSVSERLKKKLLRSIDNAKKNEDAEPENKSARKSKKKDSKQRKSQPEPDTGISINRIDIEEVSEITRATLLE